MADTTAFSFVCKELEERSSLDRLESRGTVRLALKAAGLDARTVTPDQMQVVLDRVLPRELASRGIPEGEEISRRIRIDIASIAVEESIDQPDQIFSRLGGDAT